MSELEKLTDIFRKLGANDPEGWADSQVSEGINQLGRYVFLKEAWSKIIDEEDVSWIASEIQVALARPEDPFSGIGHALSQLRERGVELELIQDVVRGKQAELLFSLCCLLDGVDDLPVEVTDLNWGLFQVDKDGKPIAPIIALHESVLDMDPTGREMRPRTTR